MCSSPQALSPHRSSWADGFLCPFPDLAPGHTHWYQQNFVHNSSAAAPRLTEAPSKPKPNI